MTAIVWFRRDLRLHDNPSLWAACHAHQHVIPVFCLDPALLHGRNRSLPRARFMLGCLSALSRELAALGSGLIVRAGRPDQILPELASACDAEAVYAAADVSPYARGRDHAVGGALAADARRLELLPGTFVVEDPAALRTGNGIPYTLFTPFHRRWLRAPRRAPLPAPQLRPLPAGFAPSPVPELDSLGIEADLPAIAAAHGGGDRVSGEQIRGGWEPGERAARELVSHFLEDRAAAYDAARDQLAEPGTSRLSPYLHFGCISARELESELGDGAGTDREGGEGGGGDGRQALRRQLCWRDFYAHVLLFNPANSTAEHQRRYRHRIRWSRSKQLFEAWCTGRTGYPLVDAAMRQLAATGWMHNRARMVTGSFLVKDLGIDWRWGERWFMRMLIDGDQASNNGNWQWIASVGVDPQPVSRRIFNPTVQQHRFDPDGSYVRAHVPELEHVPDAHLAQPWTMSAELQRRVGCVIGLHYPAPIVDHAAARREALKRYAQAVE